MHFCRGLCTFDAFIGIVIQKLSAEQHIQEYPEREELLISLIDSSWGEMEAICTSLRESFIDLYRNCKHGREKYGRFQVHWHQYCSKFLHRKACESDSMQTLWLSLTSCTSETVRNPVMIAITSTVYRYMKQD